MKLVNLTPHAINFVDSNGTPIMTVKPSGMVARVKNQTVITDFVSIMEDVFTTFAYIFKEVEGGVALPITKTEYDAVEGLPAPEPGTIYIVSSLVASRVPNREDVFIPNESVRDSEGRIVGCKSLGRV